MWIAILDWFLAVMYLGMGFWGTNGDAWDIGLGIAWLLIGWMNFWMHRRNQKRIKENIARYDQMCKEVNELRERQNRLQ